MHKPAAALSVVVEFTGKHRAGTSNKGAAPRPFWILEAYAQYPGQRYPQACEFFTFDSAQLKEAGFYEIPLVFSIKDGRAVCELDLSAARPVQTRAAA